MAFYFLLFSPFLMFISISFLFSVLRAIAVVRSFVTYFHPLLDAILIVVRFSTRKVVRVPDSDIVDRRPTDE